MAEIVLSLCLGGAVLGLMLTAFACWRCWRLTCHCRRMAQHERLVEELKPVAHVHQPVLAKGH